MNLPDLTGWVPMRVYWQESTPMVDWCYVGDRQFTEPFFAQTITKVLRHPFHALFRHQTPIQTLSAWGLAHPGLRPTGFIFHMSRCGSTLISQMLAALPQNIVISEAGPINSVLQANRHSVEVSDDQRVRWLQGVVSALGQKRHHAETHYFIKFDCWHTLDLPLIQRAFPGVPWIFVYREPVEVLVSQLRQPGSWTLPGMLHPGTFGMNLASSACMPRDEYCARVLATICEAALQHPENPAMMLNYRQLPDAIYSSLLRFFRVVYSSTDIDRMRYVSRFDAKNPYLFFTDDSLAKSRQASDRMRELALHWLGSLYGRMELLSRAHPMVC